MSPLKITFLIFAVVLSANAGTTKHKKSQEPAVAPLHEIEGAPVEPSDDKNKTTTTAPPTPTTTKTPTTPVPNTTTTTVPPITTKPTTPTAPPTSPPSPTTPPTVKPTSPPTPTTPPTPKPTPTPNSDRKFDGPSFIAGIVLTIGLTAIGFVSYKFYKARTAESTYHTL